jgi:lambda repressor-like predicted transcriptional regulator
MGRPTVFSEEVVNNIVRHIKEDSCSLADAAVRSGVSSSVVVNWMNSTQKKHKKFQRLVERSLADNKSILTESVYKHAREDGHLALRALQARHSEEWSSYRSQGGQKVLNIDNRTVNIKVLNEGVRRKILESIRASERADEAVQVGPDAGGPGDVRNQAGDNS